MNLRTILGAALFALTLPAHAQLAPTEIPELLKPWQSWVSYKDREAQCPMPYDDAKKRLCLWPSRLTLQIQKTGATLDLFVQVFSDGWVPLPAGSEAWPTDVRANGAPVPVVEHGGAPAIRLTAGAYRVGARFEWSDIPQSLTIPREIGLLSLTMDGQAVEAPAWEADGQLWLKRTEAAPPKTDEAAAADRLTVKVFRLLEDGSPVWLHTQVELTVSGKNREEIVGRVLPEGWKLSTVDGPVPAAIDGAGVLKAQVRPGKFTVTFDAFRLDNPKTLAYGAGAKPAVASELVAFRAKPNLRTIEITGAPQIETSQTSFPSEWSALPVYRWETRTALRLEERMRGAGEEKTPGLSITRQLWLDENGAGLTFHDAVGGEAQRLWRLDAAPGHELGAVEMRGQPQLITANPATHTSGVEVRSRSIELEATGRIARSGGFAAAGWLADADRLHATLDLPPGWRLFALFGADYVHGDWLTTWSLLDLFVVLLVALAVFRLGGWRTGLLALAGLALTYHEPGAPRLVWLALLVALALLRVVKEGWGRVVVLGWKWLAVAALLIIAVPFIAQQIEQAIYPELEDRAYESDSSWARRNAELDVALPSSTRGVAPRAPAQHYTSGEREIQRKLETIVIPKLELRDATIREALDVLKRRGVELDPQHQGINMVVRFDAPGLTPPPAAAPAAPTIPGLDPIPGAARVTPSPALVSPEEARITVSLSNIPLGEALRYVTGLANLKFKIEQNAIAIVPQSVPTDVYVTREWKVPPGFLAGPPAAAGSDATRGGGGVRRIEAKDYLAAAGLTFPPGASAIFLPSESRLIVRNTQENLDLIDAIVEQTTGAPNPATDNLAYDPKSRIQTGPGIPSWNWRTITFGWNGPVQKDQRVRLLLIPSFVERLLTLLRVGLVVALAGSLLGAAEWRRRLLGRGARAAALMLLLLGSVPFTRAEAVPTDEMLETLRERLHEVPDAFPHAAEIPWASLTLEGRRITMEVEIHAAADCAVPLPGKLPGWSPLTVTLDEKPEPAVRRFDGSLWVVVTAGIHRAKVEARLGDATAWEWSYRLKPRRVQVHAPGWKVTGVRPGGAPEEQIFFALEQPADQPPPPDAQAKPPGSPAAVSYESPDAQPAITIERHLELGHVWRVHNRVLRQPLSGRAVSLRVPLLPGEEVLIGANVKAGFIEVRLGEGEPSAEWESTLPVTPSLKLEARTSDSWVELWQIVAAPVWNVSFSGIAPVFESQSPESLIPSWHPWPGESVTIHVSRPEAVAGATLTIARASHQVELGKRQRSSTLELMVRASMAQDFPVMLPTAAEVTSLVVGGKAMPVRKDGAAIIVPVHAEDEQIALRWRTPVPLGLYAAPDEVRLPAGSVNVETVLHVPQDRWVLWAGGPVRGPAVRFWGILALSLLAAVVLARVPQSPLRTGAWLLLVIGLTQVPLLSALCVIAWLFALMLRGRDGFQKLHAWSYAFAQIMLIVLTFVAMRALYSAVGAGLLGKREMFITGNGSTEALLKWFQPRAETTLTQPHVLSISMWWYRVLMLLWALWLAASLIRWLQWGWQQFSRGAVFRPLFRKADPVVTRVRPAPPTPPVPPAPPSSAPQ